MTHPPLSKTDLQGMATSIRVLAMDAVEKAQSGHPGMPMGMADVATVLFSKFLKFDASHPEWPNRDRFILSAGHGSMLLYALLYLSGYKGMTLQELENFRGWNSQTPGHPEYNRDLGIETTTGPLGQGLANAVGMALAEKMLASQFGDDLVNHKVYVMVGDGCLMEGLSQEVISFAGHYQLNNLIVLFDDNHISIDGPTDLSVSDDQHMRFKASHWDVMAVNGHDLDEIEGALRQAQTSTKPVFIACKTKIGQGAPRKGGTAAVHGAPLGAEEIQATRENLKWPYPPFVVPDDILALWRSVGNQGAPLRKEWEDHLATHPHRHEFEKRLKGDLPTDWNHPLHTLLKEFITQKTSLASRQSSQMVLGALSPALPALVGGSADLTGSNNTQAKNMLPVTPGHYEGDYIHYGVREHGMAGIMNGMALYGGFIPYGGTFLVFTDYCRPSIRLSALMKLRVIYVMTHDSIGLGEDGPTHQPIEHLASLRAMPNLFVLRPADAVEVGECWEIAIKSHHAPSILALTRQKLPLVRETAGENLSAQGAYVLREAKGKRQITLLATGSEVALACDVQTLLEEKGLSAAVISMPCWELFDQQPLAYRESILGPQTFRVAIEAASPFGWERYVGEKGLICALNHFGASAPYEKLYEEFGLTPEHIVKRIEEQYTTLRS